MYASKPSENIYTILTQSSENMTKNQINLKKFFSRIAFNKKNRI